MSTPDERDSLPEVRPETLPASPMAQNAPPRAAEEYTITNEQGELRLHELLFRLGLLAGAGAFFHEALGPPWQRNLFGLAALLLSALIVSTMVFKWRVLGDWRRKSQQVLYVLFILVLTIPVAAALSPSFGQSSLPNSVETVLTELISALEKLPAMGLALGLFKGLVSFLFLGLTLVILLLGSSATRRNGIVIVGLLLSIICLFFYPSAETVAGFVFLGLFIGNEWEVPLLVPDKLRPHLRPIQVEFLMELLRQGALTTGETRIYLDNNPRHFEELLELKLVEYDSIAREVQPGVRLLHDPASEFFETVLAVGRRAVWVLFGIIYFLMPDLIPGPIDDIIVMAVCTGSGIRLFDLFRRPGTTRRIR
jgi:hypothetical protein